MTKTPDEAGLSGVPGRRMAHQSTTIGNRPLHPSTMMMGYGYDPVLSEGSLKAPIFLTSTFVFESAAHGKRFFEGITGVRPGGAEGLVYSRFNGPDQEILEDRLALWDGAEDALVFSSGMSAIATLFLALVQPGDVIVHSAPLYAATETLIGRILGKFGVTWMDFPAGATREEIEAVMTAAKAKGRVAAVYLESPANPTNALVDIEAVRAARDAVLASGDHVPPIAIDNTFLGPLWQRPLDQGADLVVYSLTKYVGGHSDLVAGAVLGTKSAINPIRSMRNTIGTITDPAQPRDAGAAHEPRRRERRQGLRDAARPPEGRARRLSRLPRAWLASGRHLCAALLGRRLDLLALSEGRRGRGIPLPRQSAAGEAGGEPRRHRIARLASGGHDASVGARGAQAGTGHHRQPRPHLDRRRAPR
jgi:hypothetical protein